MPITRPYARTARPFRDGLFRANGSGYVHHPDYAKNPSHYINSFLVLQADYLEIQQFIEPTTTNNSTFSHRLHAFLLRCCSEFETNCRAILSENGYSIGHANIRDYSKIEHSHRLSDYTIEIPNWHGLDRLRRPFSSWPLPWYRAYNRVKHDRQANFALASFGTCTDAFCGVAAILASQFICSDFRFTTRTGFYSKPHDGFEDAIGGYLRVKFPETFPERERYDFDLTKEAWSAKDFIDQFDYSLVSTKF